MHFLFTLIGVAAGSSIYGHTLEMKENVVLYEKVHKASRSELPEVEATLAVLNHNKIPHSEGEFTMNDFDESIDQVGRVKLAIAALVRVAEFHKLGLVHGNINQKNFVFASKTTPWDTLRLKDFKMAKPFIGTPYLGWTYIPSRKVDLTAVADVISDLGIDEDFIEDFKSFIDTLGYHQNASFVDWIRIMENKLWQLSEYHMEQHPEITGEFHLD